MSPSDFNIKNIKLKMKIAEDLFNFAYKIKSFQLKKNYPDWTPEKIQAKTLEQIEKGCA
jgi:hypothetical protein